MPRSEKKNMALSRRKKRILMWWNLQNRLVKRGFRKYGVHPIHRKRSVHGEYHHLMPQVMNDAQKCVEYIRMRPETFQDLLNQCIEDLTKQSTNFQKPISPTERLIVTLRFLATGESFRSLSFRFRMGLSTVQGIVKETINVIWSRLHPEQLPVPDVKIWEQTAKEFFFRWNFPQCVGAMDGKHIHLKAPFNSGSKYYNYKGYHSIVLMAIVDAKGRFLVVDIGAYGSRSDGVILQESPFGRMLSENKLQLPKPKKIQNTDIDLPFVFVGDEAFPLLPNIMRPFPRRNLTYEKRIFNYRLSRARRQVECTFGMASSMWRVLRKPIEVQVDFAVDIVKAVCVLHNFVQNKEPERTLLPDVQQNNFQLTELPATCARASGHAVSVRDTLMAYFTSQSGSLPWQNDMV